ncbi:MAG: hypothetical protein AVDCRST_MAG48-191, partial [uncultured Friedmanniella sp.]
ADEPSRGHGRLCGIGRGVVQELRKRRLRRCASRDLAPGAHPTGACPRHRIRVGSRRGRVRRDGPPGGGRRARCRAAPHGRRRARVARDRVAGRQPAGARVLSRARRPLRPRDDHRRLDAPRHAAADPGDAHRGAVARPGRHVENVASPRASAAGKAHVRGHRRRHRRPCRPGRARAGAAARRSAERLRTDGRHLDPAGIPRESEPRL